MTKPGGVKWERTPSGPWTAVTVPQKVAEGIRVVGTCPRCEHRTAYLSRQVHASKAAGETESDVRPQVPVDCDCRMPHPGRDDEHSGCGAFWFAPEPS